FCYFFQAEDGIRDRNVTGVQTCALPIFLKDICDIYLEQEDYENALAFTEQGIAAGGENKGEFMYQKVIIYERSQDYEAAYEAVRSEERRVGKGCGGWSGYRACEE